MVEGLADKVRWRRKPGKGEEWVEGQQLPLLDQNHRPTGVMGTVTRVEYTTPEGTKTYLTVVPNQTEKKPVPAGTLDKPLPDLPVQWWQQD